MTCPTDLRGGESILLALRIDDFAHPPRHWRRLMILKDHLNLEIIMISPSPTAMAIPVIT